MNNNTQEIFDKIAESWYNFRHRTIFQKELDEMAQRWQKGKLLNVGCGHGPDFPPFAQNFELYGMDISPKMLELARKYADKFNFKVELKQGDARKLPYSDGYFDFVIAVASLHHVVGKVGRINAFKEINRVLKPGGEAFITVWNKWQPKFWFKAKDVQVPWKQKTEVLYRYYHLFSYGEMASMAKKTGFKVIKSFPETGIYSRLSTFQEIFAC